MKQFQMCKVVNNTAKIDLCKYYDNDPMDVYSTCLDMLYSKYGNQKNVKIVPTKNRIQIYENDIIIDDWIMANFEFTLF